MTRGFLSNRSDRSGRLSITVAVINRRKQDIYGMRVVMFELNEDFISTIQIIVDHME